MRLPKMLRDNVLIKVPREEKTKEGVYLPQEIIDLKIATFGIAVEVGPECKIKKGDFVYWKAGVGNKIEDEYLPKDYHFIVVNEADILGYLPAEEERKKRAKK